MGLGFGVRGAAIVLVLVVVLVLEVIAVMLSAFAPAPGAHLTCMTKMSRAQRYAVFVHLDHVSKLADTIPAIFMKWLPASGHEPIRNSGFFERYGEDFNVESGRGDIEIWIPIH
jgi:hypothetical protein